MGDTRNDPCIKITELQQLFKKINKDKGNKIKQVKDNEAVLEDLHSNLNLPFVLRMNGDELEITLKTIMRKKRIHYPEQESSI